MALTENIYEVIDHIPAPFYIVHVKQVTEKLDDGVVVSKSNHRRTISPADDISGESEEIKAVCAEYHTQEVKDAYSDMIESQELS